jgi:hypothetical protein
MHRIMPERLISMYLNIWEDSSIYRDWGAVQLASQLMLGTAVEGDVALGVRIFWVPPTPGAQSSCVSCVVSLRFRVLPRYTRMRTSTNIRVYNSGQLNRLGPSGINGLGWTIFSLMLGPGRVDPCAWLAEKAGIFPNRYESYYTHP